MKRDISRYRTRLTAPQDAKAYASRFERGGRRRIDRREQTAVRRLFASLPDCQSVLDVPCGAGRFLAVLAEGSRAVTEMDVSPEAVELARSRATDLGVEARFEVGDASQLPLPDNSVDAIFCNRLLHHLTKAPERAAILRELRRVSRRWVVVSFFDYRRFGRLRVWLKRLKGRHVDYSGQPTLDEFREEFAACGLEEAALVPTGGPWVAQKYLVLEKRG